MVGVKKNVIIIEIRQSEMQKQNIDGIRKRDFRPFNHQIRHQKYRLEPAKNPARRTVFLDSIVGPIKKTYLPIQRKTARPRAKQTRQIDWKGWLNFIFQKKFSYAIVATATILAFTGGMITISNTSKTQADETQTQGRVQGQVLGASTMRVLTEPAAFGLVADVPNEVLFNLTIEQLEGYLEEALKTDEVREAESLALRKQKLKEYLEYRKSPFVGIIDTIVELRHWKLVLAISNSESSLGKRCHSNNCSGIGVEPGHLLWREYQSTADWAKDLDKLLEKRYKDWTLEEMNGVYNQPGSSNWLAAARQVLEELQERGIE